MQVDENALHEMLREVDLNKNGQVELNEFLQVSCDETDAFVFAFACPHLTNGILKSTQ